MLRSRTARANRSQGTEGGIKGVRRKEQQSAAAVSSGAPTETRAMYYRAILNSYGKDMTQTERRKIEQRQSSAVFLNPMEDERRPNYDRRKGEETVPAIPGAVRAPAGVSPHHERRRMPEAG